MANEYISKGAVLSDDELYRYALWRIWEKDRATVLWIGLNPSTANADIDDATIRRIVHFASDWGFGGIYMGNLYALRATNPVDLKRFTGDPFGPENDDWLERMAKRAESIVCCWGAHSMANGAEFYVRALFPNRRLTCLGRTNNGSPQHPVRLPANLTLQEF